MSSFIILCVIQHLVFTNIYGVKLLNYQKNIQLTKNLVLRHLCRSFIKHNKII